MNNLTRRELGRLAFGGLAAFHFGEGQKPNSTYKGVRIGAQSYSFRDRPLDGVISAMVDIGLSGCELWDGHVIPQELRARGQAGREEVRKWRLEVPLTYFTDIRAKFARAGIEINAYNLSFRDDFTDAEIARGFEMARALGVKHITASATVSVAKRVDPFARKHRIFVGMHNHSNIRPNEFATPDDFAKAMEGNSRYIAINLDIGHFTAANFDAVDFLRRNHARILTLHIKDRKRDQGANVPFGEGDTPIKEVLGLLRANKWRIPANIEYEYKGEDTVAEVRRCLEYCKRALDIA